MSNKKSNKKSGATLDEQLIGKEEPKVAKASPSGEFSLEEYSKNAPYAFNKANYKWLLAGLGINLLGFLLMIGGAAEDPNEFHKEELFGTVRITIAPMFIVLGYIVILYSIMKKPKADQQ
jgi:hypothetical protein